MRPQELGHEGLTQDRQLAYEFGHHIEHSVHPRQVAVFPQSPGRLGVDILIAIGDDQPDRVQCLVEGLLVNLHSNIVQQLSSRGQQGDILDGKLLRWHRQLGVTVLLNHLQDTLGQIAELVRQVVVHPVDHGLPREVAVIAERYFPQQEIAHLIQAELLNQ